MNKMALMAGIVVAVVVLAAVGFYILSGSGGDNPEDMLTANVNGSDYTYAEMTEEFGTETVEGEEGVPLDAIVADTGLANPETYTYVLESEDSYAMAVNWSVMQGGIVTLVEDTDDDTGDTVHYLMTLFPDLPSAYKVKYLADIEPKTGLTPIACNGLEYYLDYMPKKVDEKTVSYTKNDAVYNYTGWSLSDMVNYTGLANPETYEYTVVGYEAGAEEPWYNQTVSWDGMLGGVIVDEDRMVVFDDSTGYGSGKYRVKFVVEIIHG